MNGFFARHGMSFAFAASALLLAGGVAEARMGGGRSFGSRAMRTWSVPPATKTAPRAAQPIERSVTPQGAQPGATQRNAGMNQPNAGGLFGRGLGGGLLGGLLGAGLFGMLMGHGFLGGLSGLGSVLGLVLQLALVVFLVRGARRPFPRRSEPAMAGGAPNFREAAPRSSPGEASLRRFDIPAVGRAAGTASSAAATDIGQADLDAFETILGDVQAAYGREDIAAIRRRTTPEMLSYLTEELTQNASRGVVNTVTDVKLLQGDIAESWSEGDSDYATAAMRYSLTDTTLDRNSGAVVESGPGEASELWTFRRSRGGSWLLSAIQQA